MQKGIVLSLCDRTGVMVKPWIEAGYDAVIVDRQHTHGTEAYGRLTRVGCDITAIDAKNALAWWNPVMVFAFPACTNRAVSGAKHFKRKGLEALHESLSLVIACKRICDASGAPWLIENPVSTLSSYWRKPDAYVHPWMFAGWNEDVEKENYTKKTGLWVGGGFVLPGQNPAPPPHRDDIHKMAPSADRGDRRSVTPSGFARAVFESNEPLVRARVA
jgi:hypothetical protein